MTRSRIPGLSRWAASGVMVPVMLGTVVAPVGLAQTAEDAPTEAETAGEPAPAASQFVCQMHNGQPTVMYAPASQGSCIPGLCRRTWEVPGRPSDAAKPLAPA